MSDTERIQELADRAAFHGLVLGRWHDPNHHPMNPEPVVFALVRDGKQVRVGSLANVEKLIGRLEEAA